MTNDTWIRIEISTPAPAIDLVCTELSTFGCVGTLVEERDLDTFNIPDDECDYNSDLKLQAYFPADSNRPLLRTRIEELLEELRPLYPGRSFQLGGQQQIKQEDWAEGWKQHFTTIRIGQRLIIRPSWEDYTPRANEVVLQLDPGMAFGTGTHGTTLLCLQAIVALFDRGHAPQSLLDVGTGSGILAMAAAALGSQTVLACDIDPVACEVAAENCRLNGLEKRVRITNNPLEQLPGRYDLVVANILAEENLRLADQLIAHLAPGGYLFLSGILREKEELVCSGFSQQPLKLQQVTHEDEWVCLAWQRN